MRCIALAHISPIGMRTEVMSVTQTKVEDSRFLGAEPVVEAAMRKEVCVRRVLLEGSRTPSAPLRTEVVGDSPMFA